MNGVGPFEGIAQLQRVSLKFVTFDKASASVNADASGSATGMFEVVFNLENSLIKRN